MATKKKADKKNPATKKADTKSADKPVEKTGTKKSADKKADKEVKAKTGAVKPETKPEAKAEDNKPTSQPEVKPVVAAATKPSVNPELTKFAANCDNILKDHISRLPMSKADAVQFIKKSNPKFRVEVKDADKAKGTHMVTIFLGNESVDLQPLKLH